MWEIFFGIVKPFAIFFSCSHPTRYSLKPISGTLIMVWDILFSDFKVRDVYDDDFFVNSFD